MTRDPPRTALALTLAVVVLGAGTFATTAVATAQPATTDTPAPDAAAMEPNHTANGTAIRALHVSPALPPIDVIVNGEPIATNVSFVSISDYQAVEPGNASIQVRVNQTDEVIYDQTISLAENTSYTVLGAASVGANNTTTYEPTVIEDDIEVPSDEEASLRFLHAVSDAPGVTVTLTPIEQNATENATENVTIAENVTYRNASAYATVPAGNYTLQIAPAGADGLGEIIVQRTVNLEGGTAYTAVAFGFLNPETVGLNATLPILVGLTQDTNATTQPATPGNETTTNGTTTTATTNETTTAATTATNTTSSTFARIH